MHEAGPATRDTPWRRAVRLLLGCAAAYFLLLVADLVLYEQVMAPLAETPEPVHSGVVTVSLAERVRGGQFDPDQGVPVFEEREASAPTREGELARAVARLKGEVTDVIEGRRLAGLSFVSVQEVAGFLDAELHQASAGAPATLISSAGIVVITPDDKVAQRNYQPVTLDDAARVIEEKLHVPIRALRMLYEVSVRWDEERRRFELKLGDRTRLVAMPEDLFKLEVDRSDRLLKVYYAERLAVTWSLCVGRGGNTPVGAFHIQNKGVWPGWRAYWGEFIPGGSRRNPLGARWLGTTARGRTTGRVIGIHGTNQPSSIGRRISGGCMRLTNAHAIELYNTIPIGTRVVIHE